MLFTGKINPELLDKNLIESRLKTMRSATWMDYKPVIKKVQELHQLQMYSYEFKGQIILAVKVPLTSSKYHMDVYEVAHLPVRTAEGINIELDNDVRYLAISQHTNQYYQAITDEEFSSCKTVGKLSVCDKDLISNKMNSNNDVLDDVKCIFSIYMEKANDAKKTCTFRRAKSASKIVKLSRKITLVFMTRKSVVTINCPNEKERLIDVIGAVSFTVNYGCNVDTTNVHIAADYNTIQTVAMKDEVR